MTKIVQLVNTCRECSNRHYYSAGTYECEKVQPSRLNADMRIPDWCPLPNYPAGPEMAPEFTDTARDALLWVLWHHQGGSSSVGQPIRFALGKGQHEPLTEHEVERAKRWAAADFKTFEAPGNAGVPPCEAQSKPGTVSLATWRSRDAGKIMDEASRGVATPDGSRDAQDATRGWRPMKTAPKDGTIVRLLVDYSGEDARHPLEDATITHTIGGNTDGNTGLREGWKFAGWSWEQDCFCEGRGKPIGWLPFDAPGVRSSTDGVAPSQDERTRQFYTELSKDPAKARAFLQDAGILDERGELAEPYRPYGVSASDHQTNSFAHKD